ncbi:YcdB/YcdC domain-containing protein [Clostridium sp.]|uniref:YcdB/YcdC domain-containing protein n=1 Tax=Clostridium sp. TaxID=1506 RepID=UPI002FC5FE07
MSKSKKMLPILLAASLTVAVIPITSSYAEETLGFGFQKNNVSTKIISDNIDIKKVERSNDNGFSKVVESFKESSRNLISEAEAKSIAIDILKKYTNQAVSGEDDLSLRVENNSYILGIKGSNKYIKISNKGIVNVINTGKAENTHSAPNSKDINKSKKIVESFLKDYFSDEHENIRSVLTSENNTSGNNVCFSLQRVYNNVEVLGEGGSVVIDARDYTIKSFNMIYSNISFEKETFGRISKEKAIDIVEKSSQNGSKYIEDSGVYKLDFALRDNRDYLIDIKDGALKDDVFNEYTVDGKISSKGKIKDQLKSSSESDNVSRDIVVGLTGYEVVSCNSSDVTENKNKLIRTEVITKEGYKYFVEYDKDSLKLLNVYQSEFESIDKKLSKKISFENAYKNALSALGFLYSSKVEELLLTQSEGDIKESTTYTFKFNRAEDNIPVDGQYICVNIDAKTGQILSSIIQWSENIEIEKSSKRYVQKKRREYLEKLKGQYVYINENNLGKLYYKLTNNNN